MLHASTQKLIVKICELTDQGAIAWKEAAGDRPGSRFESEGYVVEVAADPPTVCVLGTDGRELERADAADLAATPWIGGDGTFATHVSSMASRAHRVARGAEAAISRILSSLSAPPQKMLEPEPSPAAPEFETGASPAPTTTRAAESEAAMAAITADMESLRREVRAEPPPQSRAAPKLLTPPAPSALAPIQPGPPPAPAIAETVAEALKETAKAEPEPVPLLTAAAPPVVSRPVFRPEPSPAPNPRSAFGATSSFSQAPRPAPKIAPQSAVRPPVVTPKLTPTKVTSGGLLFTGFSATTRQTVLGEQLTEGARPGAIAAPKPEAMPEPRATGADIYKPWV